MLYRLYDDISPPPNLKSFCLFRGSCIGRARLFVGRCARTRAGERARNGPGCHVFGRQRTFGTRFWDLKASRFIVSFSMFGSFYDHHSEVQLTSRSWFQLTGTGSVALSQNRFYGIRLVPLDSFSSSWLVRGLEMVSGPSGCCGPSIKPNEQREKKNL